MKLKLLTLAALAPCLLVACGSPKETKPLFVATVRVFQQVDGADACAGAENTGGGEFNGTVWPREPDAYKWAQDTSVPQIQFQFAVVEGAGGKTLKMCSAPYQMWEFGDGSETEQTEALKSFFTDHILYDPAVDFVVVDNEQDAFESPDDWYQRVRCQDSVEVTPQDYVALHVSIIDDGNTFGFSADMCKVEGP